MESKDVKELEISIEEIKKTMDVLINCLEPIITMFVEFGDNLPDLIQKYIIEEMKNEK